MGIFDGYLLMSDIDGTFERSRSYPRPQRNVDAINYFTKNGGRFAFATGRLASHLVERGLSVLTNAPCCLCNGSYVYDYQNGTVLFERRLPFTVAEFLRYFAPFQKHSKLLSIPTGVKEMEKHYLNESELPDKYLDVNPAKIVIGMDSDENAALLERALSDEPFFSGAYVSRSWSSGVELTPIDGTKGEAIDFIKKYCGAHTSVGIGDYGNDLPLIQHADIGVAVGNAVQGLKDAADMVVCDFDKGAVADLIYRLEKMINEKE